MATSSNTTATGFDASAMLEQAVSQFRGLNPSEPGQWPWLPKAAVFLLVAVAVLVIGWFALLSGSVEELDGEREREPALKSEFERKLGQAVNLNELRKQKLQVQEYVTQLEKQLPGKAEMDALLSDINQAGVGRGLQFELFRPGQVVVRDYYAELPIAIKLSGNYHDFGSFTSDIANLPRIVTLNNVQITLPERQAAASGAGPLTMEAIAKTFRYLDAEEIAEQRRLAAEAKAQTKKGAKR